MLELGKGIDIVNEIGGIQTIDDAMAVFRDKMDKNHYLRIQKIESVPILVKIANAARVCNPDAIFINTGSEADLQFIRELSIKKGEEKKLPMEGHTIHFDLQQEQGRIVDRTYYIAYEDEIISSLANQLPRVEAHADIKEKMTDIMNGKIMMVGFYSRGPKDAPVSNPAVEISSSTYVMHSAELLYRNVYETFNEQFKRLQHVFVNIHGEGTNRPEDLPRARVYMDRTHRTTYSLLCTYAGNTLLLKKGNHRFAVDKAVYTNRGNELSEHMFVTGVKGPNDRMTWFTGAAPSGCGKTTTAMAGDFFVGDDLAQMWRAADGSVRAVNPEKGIFGIVEDVNRDGDPRLMECLRNPGTEVIWSNTLIDEDGVPQWVGNGEDPENGINSQGKWQKGMKDKDGEPIPMSHPNSRCTLKSEALSNYHELSEAGEGVEIKVITYSGRDNDTMPPVWVGENADQGVVIGACIVSRATATEVGATGVKRAPWANAPFIPGSLGDYMDAQFKFFNHPDIPPDKQPILAGLNYFLTDEARGGDTDKLLGEKRDVRVWLGWLERRVHGEVDAIKTPIGYIPRYEDLKQLFNTIIEKEYPKTLYDKQFSLYLDKILHRVDLQTKAYRKEADVPQTIFDVLSIQRSGLTALKENFGAVVTPDQLAG